MPAQRNNEVRRVTKLTKVKKIKHYGNIQKDSSAVFHFTISFMSFSFNLLYRLFAVNFMSFPFNLLFRLFALKIKSILSVDTCELVNLFYSSLCHFLDRYLLKLGSRCLCPYLLLPL